MRTQIHEGFVDILCECGHPKLKHEVLNYGYRINVSCYDCNVHIALDVLE